MSQRREPNGRDPLDALIDNAARQMVAGEPSSSLRHAVRERVERRRSPWRLSPALAGAAAAVVIAAVLAGRTLTGPAGPPDERDSVRATIERPMIERAAAPEQPQVVAPAGTGSVRLQADQELVRVTRRLADDVAAQAQLPPEEESPIPPITIEPLVTAQIAVGNPIAAESSAVMPIEIEPLRIEPLRGIE